MPLLLFSRHCPTPQIVDALAQIGTGGSSAAPSERKTNMTQAEIITAIAKSTDEELLARVASILQHPDTASNTRPEEETRLVTQADAAKRLGVSPTTVWRLIKEKKTKAISVRGKQRVQLKSLLSFAGV